MTSNSDVTACNPIAIKLQIISHDPRTGSDAVAAAVPSAANASAERDDHQHYHQPKQHKIKRKRGYKHDENATVFITQEDVDVINTTPISNHGDNDVLLSDGMVCRLSKTHNGSLRPGKKRVDRMTAAAQERSSLFSNGIDGNMMDQLWAPVILRVLPCRHLQSASSLSDTSSATKHNCENSDLDHITTQSREFTPIIFIPPCISATIGIHWFCRNNTQVMSAYIHPLSRNCIGKASSATVREIGHLSPLMMDAFNNYWDENDDIADNTKTGNGDSSVPNNSIAEEERQLRHFFLSKRQDPDAEKEQHLHPSCRTTTTTPLWKPRQRLLTIGSIFATPVVATYCDCYDRIFHGGCCKESLDNVRLYQVVDILSSQKRDDDDDEIDDDSEDALLDKNRGKMAYTVSPLTHLTLQPKQTDVGLQEYGYTWRLPRPSFILSYLQSIDNNNFTKHTSHALSFEGVSNWIGTSKHDAIYHPSAKSLVDAIYLQGVIVPKNNEAAVSSNSPRIIHVIGESENNIRGCIDEAADMMGMRPLHVGGLADFLVHYNSIYNRDDARSILTGGLPDKLKGLAAALEIANQCAPCLVHVEDLDHELTPTTGQMADVSGREEEERRILQVLCDKTASSRSFTSNSFESSRFSHNVFLSSLTSPKVVVVFSTLESLPPGPISSSLQQSSISINPPDTSYARALWGHGVDGTFESLSTSLIGLSARDIGFLRQRFVHEWIKRCPSDFDSEAKTSTPISILEPLLNELEASRSFTQPSRKGGAGGSNTLPLASSSLPNVRWEDVGGMDNIRKEIMDAAELPLKYPHFFQGKQRSGILLFGPPGTGKTLVAKAVARECGLPFLSIKGPELLGSYVGESEANIRAVFDAARSAALYSSGSGSSGYSGASVLFFDELDSLAPRRGDTGFGDGVMDRVVSTLLGELDGGEAKSSTKNVVEARIIVIGATNRPDLLDPSLLRPGRFDRLLYLGPAKTKETMLKILKAQTRKFRFEPGTDPDSILQEAMESFPPTLSGADLSAVASKALMRGLKRVCDQVEREVESLNRNKDPSDTKIGIDDVMETWSKEQLEPVMCVEDFVEAAQNIVPSISQKDLDNFEKLQLQFASR